MRKLPHFAICLALAILTATYLTKSLLSTTRAAAPQQAATILIEDLHRAVDMKALPVLEVKEPF